jgi:ribonucleoside-diphosphate reductase alpha chain
MIRESFAGSTNILSGDNVTGGQDEQRLPRSGSRDGEIEMSGNALSVLAKRYLKKENGRVCETPQEMFRRVARNIASAERIYNPDISEEEIERIEEEFYGIMTRLEFLPNSPTLMNAGCELQQLSACFVLPVEDSMEGIFDSVKAAALIHKSGGGTGFSFSRLRPKDDKVMSTGGVASGPVSFMKVFNAATEAVKQGGTRRGANMGTLRVDHPDILEFIRCKVDNRELTNFNISVCVTDKFMAALEKDEEYELINPRTGAVAGRLKAKEVFDQIVQHAWKNGDPGIIFIDRINKDNPTPQLGQIESTNPCVIGDTLVSTEKGLMKIKDIDEQYSSGGLNILTDERVSDFLYVNQVSGNLMTETKAGVSLKTISGAFKTGLKPVFKVTTKSGFELTATADHQIMTSNGWVKVKDLGAGKDWVLIQGGPGEFNPDYELPFDVQNECKGENGKIYKPNLPKKWSKELGQIVGWLVGDGWLRDRDENCRIGFTFGQDDKSILEYLKPLINNFYGYDIKEVLRENNVYHLSYHSKYFVDFFKCLCIKAWSSEQKEVPDSIYTAPKDAVIGFLQGLFSADGTIGIDETNKTIYIRLTAKSLNLLKDTQLLLLNLGIYSKIYDRSRAERTGFDYISVKGESRAYTLDGICYELQISRDNIKRFIEEVGFLCDKNKEKLEILSKRNFYSSRFEDLVDKIEYLGEQQVYDLTEPETLTFISNGFISLDCGEQPLLPYEACNLGSINLAKIVKYDGSGKAIDWDKLRTLVHICVRFLDNVIDMNKYPFPQIEKMAKGNRKIGLGVMGFADLMIELGVPYDSGEAIQVAEDIMQFVSVESKRASTEIAEERSEFPNFKGSIYDKGTSFGNGMKMRNATTTTIAPTGTLSILADCSSGVEPLFAISYVRNVLNNTKLYEVNKSFERIAKERGFYSEELLNEIVQNGTVRGNALVPEDVQNVFVTAHDIAPEWHVKIQAAFQKHTNNAVSKTVNFPHSATVEDVRKVYLLAYKLGCKGVTVYRDGSREQQVLQIQKHQDGLQYSALAEAKAKGFIIPRKRPSVTVGRTEKIKTGCGNLYVTINADENGLCEVFTQMGKYGGCAASQSEAVSRLTSLALRAGVDPRSIIKHLRGRRCPSSLWAAGGMVLSCPDAIGIALQRYLKWNENNGNQAQCREDAAAGEIPQGKIEPGEFLDTMIGACPECGGTIEHEGGCLVCRLCGYTRCS